MQRTATEGAEAEDGLRRGTRSGGTRPRDRQLIWSPERSPALTSTAHVGVAGRSPNHGWPQADRVTWRHVCKWPGMGWASRGLGSRARRGMGRGTNSSPGKDPKRSQSVSPSHAPPSPPHPLPPSPCRTHPSHFPMSHPSFLPSLPLNGAGHSHLIGKGRKEISGHRGRSNRRRS